MKHIFKKTGLLFFIILMMSAGTLMAQHDHGSHQHGGSTQTHAHHPPHGGQMKEAGKYRIEMVADMFLKEDQLTFYLFKGNLKPVSHEGITGTITIEYKDGSIVTDTLLAKGSNRFVAQLEKPEPFNCTVQFLVKGKQVTTVFSHSGLGLNTVSVYSCPMHQNIKKDSPGTCPKCGMNLEKQ